MLFPELPEPWGFLSDKSPASSKGQEIPKCQRAVVELSVCTLFSRGRAESWRNCQRHPSPTCVEKTILAHTFDFLDHAGRGNSCIAPTTGKELYALVLQS
jgi:hypothetical protein